MNKLRVFQNVKNKRTVTVFGLQNSGTVLLLLFFLPYLITFLFGNLWKEGKSEDAVLLSRLEQSRYHVINTTSFGKETIPLELYVADKLGRTIDTNFEKEALKAQAILIRTNLLQKENTEILINDSKYGKEIVPEASLTAVAETKGMYLTYEGMPAYGAYFKVSNGFTREAAEALGSTEYPYLKHVVCEKDFLSEEYTDTKIYSLYELEKKWKNIPAADIQLKAEEVPRFFSEKLQMQYLRDNAGYVQWVGYQGKWVTGENFRYEFNLASSDFQIQVKGDEAFFSTKGNGHGFGMSQFGANEMAKEGKSCLEILSYFFENTSVTKTE